jgi:hypothetical protein
VWEEGLKGARPPSPHWPLLAPGCVMLHLSLSASTRGWPPPGSCCTVSCVSLACVRQVDCDAGFRLQKCLPVASCPRHSWCASLLPWLCSRRRAMDVSCCRVAHGRPRVPWLYAVCVPMALRCTGTLSYISHACSTGHATPLQRGQPCGSGRCCAFNCTSLFLERQLHVAVPLIAFHRAGTCVGVGVAVCTTRICTLRKTTPITTLLAQDENKYRPPGTAACMPPKHPGQRWTPSLRQSHTQTRHDAWHLPQATGQKREPCGRSRRTPCAVPRGQGALGVEELTATTSTRWVRA